MLPDENEEQYEERIRQKRTNILLKFMVNRLEEEGQLMFTNLVRNNRRKVVCLLQFVATFDHFSDDILLFCLLMDL